MSCGRLPPTIASPGLILDDHPLDQFLDHAHFFRRQLADGLELKPEVITRSAFAFSKHQLIETHVKLPSQPGQGVQGWLGAAGLIALDLVDVQAGAIGQGLLGHAAFLAQGGQLLGKVHGQNPQGEVVHLRGRKLPLGRWKK